MFEVLTNFIEKIKDDPIGEWVRNTTDGNPCMPFVNYSEVVRRLEQAVYNFKDEYPEYELVRYGWIMEKSKNTKETDLRKVRSQGDWRLITKLF